MRHPLEPLVAIPLLGAALLVAAPTPPPRAPVAPIVALPLGAAVGVVLFAALARRRRRTAPVGAGLVVAVAGAGEEALWRGFVLGRLASVFGVVAAVAISTVGFAASHFPAQRLRGVALQLGTGLAFGTVYATSGSLAAAASAHGVYNLLVLVGVEKRFGRTVALRDVDLSVEAGEIVALLGPNGAGKTTLVNIILGVRRPDAGEVSTNGSTGATPQEMSFPPTLRVREIVEFVRAHFPGAPPATEVLERFGLDNLAHRQAGGLSGGQQRRLAIAVAFAGDPKLAVLDEPTTGLDVESRLAVWEEIRAHAAGGGAVLFTTHHLEEAAALATRIVVLSHGRVVARGAPESFGPSLEEAYLKLTR